MKKPTTLPRRAVLRGAGLLISLPLLESCSKLPDSVPTLPAREQATRTEGLSTLRAKRFIALVAPNGVDPDYWYPTGSETGFALNQQNAPLEPIRQHLLMTSGIANKVAVDGAASGNGNGHAEGVASMLTGWAPFESPKGSNQWRANGGPSIDQLLSDFHTANGYVGRARGIHMGEEGSGPYSSVSIKPDGRQEDYFSDLDVLFDPAGSSTAQALEAARLRRKSVLDGSKADFTALSARVSGEDKARIDQHLEALRSIEKRFEGMVAQCKRPTLANAMDDNQRRDVFYDIIVATLACDATRVATVYLRHSGGGGPKLPFINVFEDIHELSHQIVGAPVGASSRADFTKYHQWFSQKTLSLVQKLKAVSVPEGGTLFDDVVLFQGTELGYDHACPNMPFFLIAGEKTPFATGRFVKFLPAAMHTHLLVSLLNAFGHPATRVGDPRYLSGNLNARLFKAT